ncbi:MAG: hypothetical protein RIS92_420 [Verrucomicrobiota bacterium]|jgi:hypothetical protein
MPNTFEPLPPYVTVCKPLKLLMKRLLAFDMRFTAPPSYD